MMNRNQIQREGLHVPQALVRRPSPNLADGLVTHIDRQPVDIDLAYQQWDGYVVALNANGWATIEVDPAPEHADAVFIEDMVVVFNGIAVITRPGAEARRGELEPVEPIVTELGFEIGRIKGPGTLDGGDVLKVGDTIYVGRGGRTTDAGIDELRELLAPRGATVIAVDVTKALHLKSALTALPDGTIVGYEPVIDDPTVFPSFLGVPEDPGSHVVLLGDNRLLMSAAAPQTAELYRSLGYEPITVDISEFEKLEGCVTCLSVQL